MCIMCLQLYTALKRVNRSINEALRSYVRKDQREWDHYLDCINCSLRNSVHQTTGRTPYQLVFGQMMITHGQDYKLLRRLKLLEEVDVEIETRDRFTLLRDEIRNLVRKAYDKNVRNYNLRSRIKGFEIGQDVIRRNFVQSSKADNFNSKLAP